MCFSSRFLDVAVYRNQVSKSLLAMASEEKAQRSLEERKKQTKPLLGRFSREPDSRTGQDTRTNP